MLRGGSWATELRTDAAAIAAHLAAWHHSSAGLRSGAELPPWFWGVVVCVVGSTLTALGLVMQKKSHTMNAIAASESEDGKGTIFYKQPLWATGLTVFLSGQILNVISMSMAPQVILSCLGAWSLITNAAFAWGFLGEVLVTLQVVAMVGMIIGVVMVILGTPPSTSDATGDIREIAGGFVAIEFLAMMSIFTCCLAGLWVLTAKVYPNLVAVFWTVVAALSSGFTVTLFKCISLLLVMVPASAPMPWTHPATYVLIVVTVVWSLSLMSCLNKGLEEGEALVVVPTYYALGMLAQITVGAVYFHELNGFTGPGQIALFASGVALLIVCIVTMTAAGITSEEETLDEVLGMEESDIVKLQRAHKDDVVIPGTPVSLSSKASSPCGTPRGEPTESSMVTGKYLKLPEATASSALKGGLRASGRKASFVAKVVLNLPEEKRKTMRDKRITQSRKTVLGREGPRVTTFDPDFFEDSFGGGKRKYTVALAGGMGMV